MENRITHYKFVSTVYTVKHYKDTNKVSPDNSIQKNFNSKNLKWSRNYIHTSCDEKEFLEYFSDVTKGVEMERVTVVVEENGDKISLKTYFNIKKRRVGTKFFYVKKILNYATYNFRLKNLYTGSISRSKKRLNSKKCRTNDFTMVFNPYSFMGDKIVQTRMINISNNVKDYKDTNIDVEMTKITSCLIHLIKERTGKTLLPDNGYNELSNLFYQLYLIDNDIKIPNSFYKFRRFFISKKDLKTEYNLVSTFMRLNNLKGSKIKKYLNLEIECSIDVIINTFNVLGVDFFNKVNEDYFTKEKHTQYGGIINIDNRTTYNHTNNDKNKIVLGLNLGIDLYTLIEHFEFKQKLLKYDYDFKIRFKDKQSFVDEHYRISEMVESFKTGVVHRFYGNRTKDLIEDVILSPIGVDFYPVLLWDTETYNEESLIQNNCVRTYIEKPNNIIVSLRLGNEKSKERATIEYQFRKNDMIRVQSRSKFNNDVPETWNSALEILDKRMSDNYKKGVITLPRLEKELFNGYKITRNSVFEREEDVQIQRIVPVWDEEIEKNEVDIFDLFF